MSLPPSQNRTSLGLEALLQMLRKWNYHKFGYSYEEETGKSSLVMFLLLVLISAACNG